MNINFDALRREGERKGYSKLLRRDLGITIVCFAAIIISLWRYRDINRLYEQARHLTAVFDAVGMAVLVLFSYFGLRVVGLWFYKERAKHPNLPSDHLPPSYRVYLWSAVAVLLILVVIAVIYTVRAGLVEWK